MYDFANRFYFRSNNQFLIESQSLDGSNRQLITQGRGHCHSISYDWVGNNIFWASARKIEVFSLSNPNMTKTLIHAHNAGYVHVYCKLIKAFDLLKNDFIYMETIRY